MSRLPAAGPLLVLLLVATGGVPEASAAVSATCLPGGFPDAPTPPVFTATANAASSADAFTIEVWRVVCQDDSGETAVLLRATPISRLPYVCSYEFEIFQDGQQTDAILMLANGAGFCSNLVHPAIFFLDRSQSYYSPSIPFNTTEAFTLLHVAYSEKDRGLILEIPAGGPPGLTVVSTGCNPCRAGDTASFHVHVSNPGDRVGVELKTATHLPNGGPTLTILGEFVGRMLESGDVDIPLTSILITDDLPNGTYTIEAAILNPVVGTTISRHRLDVVKH
jgi:hypothetical protein